MLDPHATREPDVRFAVSTTPVTQRWRSGLWVPVVALVAVLASGAWLWTQQSASGWRGGWGMSSSAPTSNADDGGMMGGDGSSYFGMMDGYAWSDEGAQPVENLSQARDRATNYAEVLQSGLQVGEVMRFENHYYADLQESDGTKVTEVLIDARSGSVRPEMGPAVMWNTRFAMMHQGLSSANEITAKQAQDLADQWLMKHDRGLASEDPAHFPGYYTLHTVKDGNIVGMLSINASTGDVWHHSWHGDFVEMSKHA